MQKAILTSRISSSLLSRSYILPTALHLHSPTTHVARLHSSRLTKTPVVVAPHPNLGIDPNNPQTPPHHSHGKVVGPHPNLQLDPNNPQSGNSLDEPAVKDYMLRHPVYTPEELEVQVTHVPQKGLSDWVAFSAMRLLRLGFDTATNYSDKLGVMTERQWLNRILFLETLAGVPGMVGAMLRHLRSLRLLRRDNGWVHTLLEEAENERMHLLTFMKLKHPSPFFRLVVLLAQGVWFNAFFLAYLIHPKTCHRFVGYLEEEAVHTYTNCLKDMEVGQIKHWKELEAPGIAKSYWRLKDNATVADVVRAVRADESNHRDVNHALAVLKPDEPNPF